MKYITKYLTGDKPLWGIIILFMLISFLPVYSSSSNLVYVIGKGTTSGALLRHFVILSIGFIVIWGVHRVKYSLFKFLSVVAIFISTILLIYVLFKGTQIQGESASRWIRILGISFQPSSFAMVAVAAYSASFFTYIKEHCTTFENNFLYFWFPVLTNIALVGLVNLSTGLIIYATVFMLAFISGYSFKQSLKVIGITIAAVLLLFLVNKAFPNLIPNRGKTWESRIESFLNNEKKEEAYQLKRSKMAIALGGLTGKGFGKSAMRNHIPYSYSDFIFAIILEEAGLILGGGILIFLYFCMLLRILIISHKSSSLFGKLLVLATGVPIILQAFIHMGVCTGLIPTTGQNLPFFTSGGSSLVMTCLALGIVLSVSASTQPIAETQPDNASTENSIATEALQTVS